MVAIYVLKLTNNKYYIGKTNNPEFRINNHFNNSGSKWTMKYKPIKIVKIFKNCDDYDEDKYTLKYMNQYGIDNVRGGTFTQIKLTDSQKDFINSMINGANDNCFICGKSGHFVSNCPDKYKRNDKEPENIKNDKEDENKPQKTDWKNNSYTKLFVNGINILNNLFSSNKNKNQNNTIPKNDDKDWYIVSKPKNKKENMNCYRCGRTGHFINECYAKYHIKGFIIKNKKKKYDTFNQVIEEIQTQGICLID
jgi:hypothetical protein